MEFHKINIIYAALPTHAQTENTTFSCKYNILNAKLSYQQQVLDTEGQEI